tara:strand:- start:1029 stop:1235 length:207 start_codon:yes stop_codon:yes gene_type:complete
MELKMKIKNYAEKLKNRSTKELKKAVISFIASKVIARVLIILIITVLTALGVSTELIETITNTVSSIF